MWKLISVFDNKKKMAAMKEDSGAQLCTGNTRGRSSHYISDTQVSIQQYHANTSVNIQQYHSNNLVNIQQYHSNY